MPETVKKVKLFQVAKDLNLSTSTVQEFLKSKNVKVASAMSLLDEKSLDLVYQKFKKEKVAADKIHKKEEDKKHAIEEDKKEKESKKVEKVLEEVSELASPNAAPEVSEPIPAVGVKEGKSGSPAEMKAGTKETREITAREMAAVKMNRAVDAKAIEKFVEKKEAAKKLVKKEKEEKVETEGEKKVPSLTETLEAKLRKEEQLAKLKKEKHLSEETEVVEIEPAKEEELYERVTSLYRGKKTKKVKVTQKEITVGLDKKRGKKKKIVIDPKEVEKSIRQTLAEIEDTSKGRKKKRRIKTETGEVIEEETNIIQVPEFISAGELAKLIDISAQEVIKKCIGLGLMVTMNQRLDFETITLVLDEFGFKAELLQEYGLDRLEEDEIEEAGESRLVERPPVVTIMGHVDHGKTTLLDYIRSSNVVAGESGGITQHIGAYEVSLSGKKITFLDTPGHEAFTSMRARGAQVTDVVVLVVAADDAVMPQTIEAIDHAKAAEVPIIVAINKIDKSTANIDLIRKQLADAGVLVEQWGGKYSSVEISAKKGLNVDKLLELILLQAEVLELKANPNKRAQGVIIESKLDKGRGVVASVLVQNGTLKIGEPFIAGQYAGKVRSMFNERGQPADEAPPSTPVQVSGFDGIPQAGDRFMVLSSDREVREISLKRQQIKREQDFRQVKTLSLDQISQQVQEGSAQVRELSLIVKGDVDGSVEALSDSLIKLSNNEVGIRVIRKAVGLITESDVVLAAASNAIIIGFHVRPNLKAKELAEQEQVDVRIYKIIYDAINEVKQALEGLLAPEVKEKLLGTIEVRQTFKVSKVGTVAGSYVRSGKIQRSSKVRLVREGIEVYDGKISSLKRFKDDASEVLEGFECGVQLENYHDIKVGDVIESYEMIEIKRKLS